MIGSVQSSLIAINKISRQLLSQLDIQVEDSDSEKAQNSTATNEESQLTDELLGSIATERHSLIAKLFEVYTREQLSAELLLVNEMVSLDQQLAIKSQLKKQAIAEQMLKLRNSKKATKLYQKY